MNPTARIELADDLAELDRLAVFLQESGRSLGLTERDIHAFNVCLEELVTNVIQHGSRDGRRHRMILELGITEGVAVAELVDDSTPYNPLSRPEVDTTAPLADRTVGGLGVHLVRQLMDSIEYEHNGGCNHLILRRYVARPADRALAERRFAIVIDHPTPDSTVVHLRGRLDTLSAPLFRQALARVDVHPRHCIVLELSGLDYIGSAGLGVILTTGKHFRESLASLRFAALREPTRGILEVSGFLALFPCFATAADALAAPPDTSGQA